MDKFTPHSRSTKYRRIASEVKKMCNEAQQSTSTQIARTCIAFDFHSVGAEIDCQSHTPPSAGSSDAISLSPIRNVFETSDVFSDNNYCTSLNQNRSHDVGDAYSISQNNTAMSCILGQNDTSDPFLEPDNWNAREVHSSDEDNSTVAEHNLTLRENLTEWGISHNLSHSAVGDLLRILQPLHPELPLTAKCLFKTTRKAEIRSVAGGDYYYFGLQYWLEFSVLNRNLDTNIDELTLHVNIDGIPLFRSSNMSLWPILCSVKEVAGSLFPVAIFCGPHKPHSLTEYLNDFVTELKALQHSGLVGQNGKCVHVKLGAVICDAPARAFVKAIKTHNAYNSCERCVQQGEWDGKIILPDLAAPLRTDESFQNREDSVHHIGVSPFETLGIGMVTCFPLDYMHLICLGVVRRLLNLWVNGPRSCKLSQVTITAISDRLVAVRAYIPRDFARKPRSLSEFRLWKATELRLFLLYVGPVVLKGLIPRENYINFLDFSVATRILLCHSLLKSYQNFSRDLMIYFVESFSNLYGIDQLVYNVHSLIHLADDATNFGVLDNVSSFKFETYLGKMKKLVRRPQQPCTQIVCRILEGGGIPKCSDKQSEMFTFRKPHTDGPITESLRHCEQYKQCQSSHCFISTEAGDNCFEVQGKIGIVRNIVKDVVGSCNGWVLFQEFDKLQSFFHDPLDSKLLSIFRVSNPEGCCKVYLLCDVRNKYVTFPFTDGYVVLPQLHF